jgi:hypothetical protein
LLKSCGYGILAEDFAEGFSCSGTHVKDFSILADAIVGSVFTGDMLSWEEVLQ